MEIQIEPFVGEKYCVELFSNKEPYELEKWIRHNISDVKRYAVLEEIAMSQIVTAGEEIPAQQLVIREPN